MWIARCVLLSALIWGLTDIVRAAEWSVIADRGHLIVAVSETVRPLGFRDTQGQLQGFEIDIARQLALELLGDPGAVVLKPVLNPDRLTAVTSGRVDIAIANLTLTENRKRVVNFSQPYHQSATGLITSSSRIRTAQDLTAIAVLQRSHNIAILRSAFPDARLVGVSTYQEAQAALAEHKADAFGGDQVVLTGWQQQNPNYRTVGQPLAPRSLAIALPKGLQYNSLLERINQSLRQLSESGWLLQRRQYWGLGSQSVHQ
jgi:polar amino acid transport system substrate-binding protein